MSMTMTMLFAIVLPEGIEQQYAKRYGATPVQPRSVFLYAVSAGSQ